MKIQKTHRDLNHKIAHYLPPADVEKINAALAFAQKAHEGQTRNSGEPYISHPVEVACILGDLEQDADSLCAGLLHDTIEDCNISQDTLAQQFGDDVAQLVMGVTKLGKLSFSSKEEEQAENFRKMFLAMAKDIRVVIIKLADRLHNMRTLKFLSKDRQQKIANETRDIFAPLAHRLGMWSLKWELEDLCFYYLEPDAFQNIKKQVTFKRHEREQYVEQFTTLLKERLSQTRLKTAIITGRPKHFFSIHKKMVSQNLSFDDLYDTFGVRIMVDTVSDCYEVLGIVHSLFKPLNGRFKDYIAMPKSNLYQSLHTTVMGQGGTPVEVQIRTKDMHQIAEYGIAAHWRYKEGQAHTRFDADFSWLRQIIETQKEKTAPKDFLQSLQVDLFMDEVFVFTPKGDVHVLPKGATVLDFAYKIHTQIGHRCKGAKANNHIVPLNYRLRSGDILEILTGKQENPTISWLTIVKSNQAKTKIKQWFKKQNAIENSQKGKTTLERLLMVSGHLPKDALTEAVAEPLFKRLNILKWEDLYLGIALGDISAKEVVAYIGTLLTPEPTTEALIAAATNKPSKKTGDGGIRVLGEHNIRVNLAKCCHPLPGDAIIGFITMGFGVSVHRTDCINIAHLEDKERARLIDVEWDVFVKDQVYKAVLEIEAFDSIGILQEIINQITNTRTNIKEVKTRSFKKGGTMRATVTVDIRDTQHLGQIKTAISQISDVYAVKRVI
ncbi:MAG: bifunctional (p)ppGpp synthetase/guanosine-3',5'-bis(diphosphate) 3'-pyrophosphohydrolase [Candidatus Margulisiibacteriota bacterium]